MGYAELNIDDINAIFSHPRGPSLISSPTQVLGMKYLYLLGSVRRDQSHISFWLTEGISGASTAQINQCGSYRS